MRLFWQALCRRPYPAAVTRLTRPIGCIDLLLDILRIISRGGNFFSLDDLDVIVKGRRVVVCFSLHRRLYPCIRFGDTLTHGVCRVGLVILLDASRRLCLGTAARVGLLEPDKIQENERPIEGTFAAWFNLATWLRNQGAILYLVQPQATLLLNHDSEGWPAAKHNLGTQSANQLMEYPD